MKTVRNRTFWVSIILLAGILTVATAYVGIRHKNTITREAALPVKQYVCSMHPQVVQNSPGDCPICGMFLIEKIADDDNDIDSSLTDVVRHVNESVIASVATIRPVFETLPVTIETSGILTCDPRNIKTISARFGGVIDRSFIKYEFQPVGKGQKIYQIYCPEIYIEKWNYVKLIQAFPDQDNLTTEARRWFRLLGLTSGQIDSLKKAVKPDYHLMVYSDADGFVVGPDFNPDNYFTSGTGGENSNGSVASSERKIELNDGETIEKGSSLFKVVNLNTLRADLKVRTEDVRLLKVGQKVTISDETLDGTDFKGTVAQIEPLNGGLFQIVKVYINNTGNRIFPGRQINGRITAAERKALWLPETAVLDLGSHQSVFLFQKGSFVSTPVVTGIKLKNRIEILSGIETDSEIALNGLMLVDSDGFVSSVY